MENRLNRFARFLLSIVVSLSAFIIIHEGLHVIFATIYGEYAGIRVVWLGFVPFGVEVLMQTSPSDISGSKWILISGMSNFVTLAIGYMLFSFRLRFSKIGNILLKSLFFHATLIFMIVDAFNLSFGPFIYGGDIQGIACGLNVNLHVLQVPFILLFLLNRELIARSLLPVYGVSTKHPLFVVWFSKKKN
jgi:hypothetical protein